MGSNKTTVLFFAEGDLVTTYLIDQLLQKGCQIVIACTDPSLWKQGSLALADNPNIYFTEIRHVNSIRSDYIVVTAGLPIPWGRPSSNSKNAEALIASAANYAVLYHPKVLTLAPILLNDAEQAKKVRFLQNNFAQISLKKNVYLGDLYARGMDYTDQRAITKILVSSAKGVFPVVPEQHVFPLYVLDAVDNIIRLLFSYWSSGEEIALANIFTTSQLLQQDYFSKTSATYEEVSLPSYEYSAKLQIQAPRLSTPDTFALVAGWIKQFQVQLPQPAIREPLRMPEVNLPTKDVKAALSKIKISRPNISVGMPRPKIAIKNVKLRIPRSKPVGIVLAGFFLWLVVLPFIHASLAGVILGFSYNNFKSGKAPSPSVLGVARDFSNYSKNGFLRLSAIPLVGKPFAPVLSKVILLQKGATMAVHAGAIYKTGTQLVDNFFGDDPYDVKTLTEPLYLELDALYKEASFLDGELPNHPRIKKWLEDRDWGKLRSYILSARDIAPALPDVLASGTRKSYMLLLQNNTELRPTGGFIGSFALLTLENGHMSDLSVFDVYTADGQLKGHVEPPAPIKNYLGEANWYLRDSNWNPDFEASGRQAEWFLEKEMERRVDGVIGIDLEVLKALMEYSGDIYLPDFGETLTAVNVYEKIQYEVESNFFPGSQTKASLLTALTRQLLNKVKLEGGSNRGKLAQVLYDNLDRKHIQVYLHNQQAMNALTSLGWAGEVSIPKCSAENCQPIWLGLAEANVGVNKANYYIKRESSLRVELGSKEISYILDINIANTAENVGFALGGRYKSYLRVLASLGSQFDQVEIINGSNTRKVEPELYEVAERVEAGVVFEVPQGETRTLRFRWQEPTKANFAQSGQLEFLWRKQAGTIADPVKVQILDSEGLILTQDALPSYNTSLERDLRTRINW